MSTDNRILNKWKAAMKHQGERTDLVDNVNEVGRPDGNSQSAALRRLRKDRPDLNARVLESELSAHAATMRSAVRRLRS